MPDKLVGSAMVRVFLYLFVSMINLAYLSNSFRSECTVFGREGTKTQGDDRSSSPPVGSLNVSIIVSPSISTGVQVSNSCLCFFSLANVTPQRDSHLKYRQ